MSLETDGPITTLYDLPVQYGEITRIPASFPTSKLDTVPSCEAKCRSTEHGDKVVAIATKGSDIQVINLWMQSCGNFARVTNYEGYSAIHVAAATGRTKVVIWLVNYHGVNVNVKETRRGFTPLHISLYHGHLDVARTLISLGANPSLQDNDGFSALELTVKDRQEFCLQAIKFGPSDLETVGCDAFDVFIWGSNDNYTLGIGKENGRIAPELLDLVEIQNPLDFILVLQTYHSVFLQIGTGCADVRVCGTGSRLGVGSMTALTPMPVTFNVRDSVHCCYAAAGPDHTIFLMTNGGVWSCGTNEHFVLGHDSLPSNSVVSLPQRILSLRNQRITCVAGSQFHSVFCTSSDVFMCGINKGQLGFSDLSPLVSIITPQKIALLWPAQKPLTIRQVYCNDFATVISNNSPVLHVLYNNGRYRIDLRCAGNIETIVNIAVIGGSWSALHSICGKYPDGRESLKVFILSELSKTNCELRAYIWNLRDPANDSVGDLYHVNFICGHPLDLIDFAVNKKEILVITKGGEAYIGDSDNYLSPIVLVDEKSIDAGRAGGDGLEWVSSRKKKTSGFPIGNIYERIIRMKRIPNIHRGVKVSCSPKKGSSFAIIQRRHKISYVDTLEAIRKMSVPVGEQLGIFLNVSSHEDSLHDIQFKCGMQIITAHKYIVSKTSKTLLDLISTTSRHANVPVSLEILGFEPVTFEEVLRQLYRAFGASKIPDNNELLNSNKFPKFNECWHKFQPTYRETCEITIGDAEFSDVILVCNNEIRVPAHRCMLASSLLYFDVMFKSSTWVESTAKSPNVRIPFGYSVVCYLLRYSYGLLTPEMILMENPGIEFLVELMQMADMYDCLFLKNSAEHLLARKVNQRSVAEILKVSKIFNTAFLYAWCAEYIVETLVYQLENRLLDVLDDEMISGIADFYKILIFDLDNRRLKPSAFTPSSHFYASAIYPMTEENFNTQIESDNLISTVDECAGSPRKAERITKVRLKSESFSETPDSLAPLDSVPRVIPENVESQRSVETKWTKVPRPSERHRSRKSSGENDIELTAVKPKSTTPSPVPVLYQRIKSLPIPTPMKEKAMQAQNIKLKQAKSQFDIASDFPCLERPKELQQTSQAGASPTQSILKAKKKIRWISLSESFEEEVDIQEMKETEVQGTPPPTNPWKLAPTPKQKEIETLPLQEIIAQEEMKKENFLKAIHKPLRLVQMEELAIQQLRERYTTQDVLDGIERIEICRSSEQNTYMDPTWPCEKIRRKNSIGGVAGSQSPGSSGISKPIVTDDFPQLSK